MDQFGFSAIQIPKLAFLLTLAAGCVNLNKPNNVQECAVKGNCSDDPNLQQGPDAKQDTQPPGPDLPFADEPQANADLGQDGPIHDVPADHVEQGGDTQGGDTKEVSGPDAKETSTPSDADSGLPPADVGPDLARDTNRQDAVPDLAPDLVPDLAPDLKPDLTPDLTPDLAPDLAPDASTLTSGLLAYYKCESVTGTTLQDSSGKGNHGTMAAAGYTFATGKVGNALTLTKASSAYVTLPPAMFANVTDITIATWVNVSTSASWARVFDIGVNAKIANNTQTGTKYLNLVPKNSGTNLAFSISKDGYGSEQVLTATTLATGTWKHVAVVLASGQGSLYVDGALVTGPSAIALRPVDLGTIDYAYLGKSQFTSDPYFDGLIDEFRVYGRALSAAEIQALHQFVGP
ncbi:MAG TPA: LamG-like jellyroll fold domain-containing protein [Polyangia bacterium]